MLLFLLALLVCASQADDVVLDDDNNNNPLLSEFVDNEASEGVLTGVSGLDPLSAILVAGAPEAAVSVSNAGAGVSTGLFTFCFEEHGIAAIVVCPFQALQFVFLGVALGVAGISSSVGQIVG